MQRGASAVTFITVVLTLLSGVPVNSPALPVALRQLVDASRRTLVVLDDDPGGTQTVHDIAVLTDWSVDAIVHGFEQSPRCFFILANTRSLCASEAAERTRLIAGNLLAGAKRIGRDFAIVSRSDSTLRGHFWEEIEALTTTPGMSFRAVVFVPAFFEAGRVTIDNVHYVKDEERLTPVAETEFSRDATFGFGQSDLRLFIQEKSRGQISAQQIVSIDLATLRNARGATQVRDCLLAAPLNAFFVVNAADYRDMAVFTQGLLKAEQQGGRFLCRAAPSFIRLRAAIPPRSLLTGAEVQHASGTGGLVVAGSYTGKTTAQLQRALDRPDVVGVEFRVDQLGSAGTRDVEIQQKAAEIDRVLRADGTCIVFTSRALHTSIGRAGELGTIHLVSSALVELVRRLTVPPRFLVAKGGMTASDLATKALGARNALVAGQILEGIPVWKLAQQSRIPGLPLIIFPGNFGTASTLDDLLTRLTMPSA